MKNFTTNLQFETELCAKCSLYRYGIYDEDVLDEHKIEILEKFN